MLKTSDMGQAWNNSNLPSLPTRKSKSHISHHDLGAHWQTDVMMPAARVTWTLRKSMTQTKERSGRRGRHEQSRQLNDHNIFVAGIEPPTHDTAPENERPIPAPKEREKHASLALLAIQSFVSRMSRFLLRPALFSVACSISRCRNIDITGRDNNLLTYTGCARSLFLCNVHAQHAIATAVHRR